MTELKHTSSITQYVNIRMASPRLENQKNLNVISGLSKFNFSKDPLPCTMAFKGDHRSYIISFRINKVSLSIMPYTWHFKEVPEPLKTNWVYLPLTSSRSVKLILCRSLSSSAWSGTDICVAYFTWGKECGVRARLRPAPGVDSGEMSLVSRPSETAENFFLFFSEERLAFFWWIPQSCNQDQGCQIKMPEHR